MATGSHVVKCSFVPRRGHTDGLAVAAVVVLAGRDLPVAGPFFDPLGRRQPHPFPPGPLLGGQPTTIGIPHAIGIAHTAPPVSSVQNLRQ
jgi:hypothetical protein